MLEATRIEYKSTLIKLFSNKIFIIIIEVLNLTESPIPNNIDCFVPSSFLPIIQLPKSFAPFETATTKRINKGKVIKYFISIDTPTHKKNIGAKNP